MIILLDEYDTPIQEAYVNGYWEEKNLADTVKAALKQIEDKNYKSALAAEEISEDRIRTYGFGFEGNKVLIG